MPLSQIIEFCKDALEFSLPLSLCLLLFSFLIKREKNAVDWKKEGQVFFFSLYLLSLLKITVIRQSNIESFSLSGGWENVQLLPLITTFAELQYGLWAFLYPVLGNILWFVPLGYFVRSFKTNITVKECLLIGCGLSLFIELGQWLLSSGISDVDDIIFNVTGAGLGFVLQPVLIKFYCFCKEKLL